MSRADRMQPIKELADNRERDAGTVVAGAQQKLQECERQLEQLLRYREDYSARNNNDVGSSDALRLQNYRAFLQRISDAIQQQERAVQLAREDYERKRDAWRDRRVEANSLGRAIERFKSEDRKVEEHREQLSLEEQAAAQRRSRELTNESGTWKVENTGRWKIDKNN